MRPNPFLWLPPPGQGFPLLPGREEELVDRKKGDGEGEVNNSKKRKSSRRGNANNKSNSVDLMIIHSNTDGYKSKKESIHEIATNEKPDILTLNDREI